MVERLKFLFKPPVIFLLGIFIFALFVRVFQLEKIPYGFHVDEIDVGYVGRYILMHGEDIYGNKIPLVFNKFGDFRPAAIFYLSGLSTFIFGLNEFAVRFPSALFGALSIFPIYFLSQALFNNKRLSLVCAAFLAVIPWHIVLSRATSEAIIGLFFMLCGIYYFIKGLQVGGKKYFFLSLLFVFVSTLFYHTFRLLAPLIFLPGFFFTNSYSKRFSIGLFAFFILLIGVVSLTPWGSGRFQQVAFYNNPVLSNTIEVLLAGEGQNNITVARIFHNKAVIYSREFLNQYLSYFSPQFLFISGGLPHRYAVLEQGLLYITFSLLILAGFASIFLLKASSFNKLYVFYLLLIAPLPAALTFEDSPNIHRVLFLMIPLVIFAGVGLEALLKSFSKRIIYRNLFISFVCFLLILEGSYFWHQYSVHTTTTQNFYRNDGFQELINEIMKSKALYETVYMPAYEDIPIYYLFRNKDFSYLEKGDVTLGNIILSTSNISFVKDWCPSTFLNKDEIDNPENVLLVDKEDCRKVDDVKEVGRIKKRDSLDAFILKEYSR